MSGQERKTGKRVLNVGLLAHVDAGKTTLSESILYQSGAIRNLGRVDHQDAFLDTDEMERERGITIFSKQAVLTWKDTVAQGDVKDDLLTVYCSTEVQKSMLDQKAVTDVLSEVTSRAVGREIRVRFLVGERPGAKKRDKMQDLLRMGSKFDNFTVK